MGPADRLIGRDRVLAAAQSVAADAARGFGQFLLITGEAGIGKTAVLDALVAHAEPGSLILRGTCWDGPGVPPYWPWSQVLRTTVLSTAELGEAGWLLDAAAGLPESIKDAAAAADAQFRLFEVIARVLNRLAKHHPMVVVIDDLHWADEPSLRLLEFLARALSTSPVLLLGAYRDDEAPTHLTRLAGAAHQLALAGLAPADVEAMVQAMAGQTLPPAIAAQLWQRSGGNPFFVRELTRLILAQGARHGDTEIPAGVAETLRRRLARLSTPCVRLLDWAAVIGRDIEIALLAQCGATVDEVTAASLLDEARRAGVITGGEPRFAHDLYRETILAGQSTSTKAAIDLAVGRTLQTRHSSAARVAAHLRAAGSSAQHDAITYLILAGREATARLGHDDAVEQYRHALRLMDTHGVPDPERVTLLLELAAAHERAGSPDLARQRYRDAAQTALATADPVSLSAAALGLHSIGHRSGGPDATIIELLREAARQLQASGGPLSVQSQLAAALAREWRHGSIRLPDDETIRMAHRAVELATAAGDAKALAAAKLAEQDSMWRPGTAATRLPVITEMLAAATSCADRDLIAEAHLLRSAALLELGDPTGRDELTMYITLANNLGHARGRWCALSRQATLAQIAGRAEEAARLGQQALELGLAIGEPDANACFVTSRWSLVAAGIREPATGLDTADPLWPMFPIFKAWPPAARGDTVAAKAALGDFSVLDIAEVTGTEGLAAAAVVFAVVGTESQRSWTYQKLLPLAGTHVLVAGCASYHAAVDHHLGALAAALGDTTTAATHFRDALALHQRLGAAGWARLSEQALAQLSATATAPANEFRVANGVRLLSYRGRHAQLPDSKGLADIAVLLGAHGHDVHVRTLVGDQSGSLGADPILDDHAKAAYKARLDSLAAEIDENNNDLAETLRAERDELIHQLAAAAGLGGRNRRLGDDTERARKRVSARVRDALFKIEQVHPELAEHLRATLQLGTVCAYDEHEPTTWKLR